MCVCCSFWCSERVGTQVCSTELNGKRSQAVTLGHENERHQSLQNLIHIVKKKFSFVLRTGVVCVCVCVWEREREREREREFVCVCACICSLSCVHVCVCVCVCVWERERERERDETFHPEVLRFPLGRIAWGFDASSLLCGRAAPRTDPTWWRGTPRYCLHQENCRDPVSGYLLLTAHCHFSMLCTGFWSWNQSGCENQADVSTPQQSLRITWNPVGALFFKQFGGGLRVLDERNYVVHVVNDSQTSLKQTAASGLAFTLWISKCLTTCLSQSVESCRWYRVRHQLRHCDVFFPVLCEAWPVLSHWSFVVEITAANKGLSKKFDTRNFAVFSGRSRIGEGHPCHCLNRCATPGGPKLQCSPSCAHVFAFPYPDPDVRQTTLRLIYCEERDVNSSSVLFCPSLCEFGSQISLPFWSRSDCFAQ